MKRSATDKKSSARKNRRPAKVPTYEDFLTHIFDSIDYSSGIEKPQRISATDKLKFRQFDLHPERLGLPAYRRIIRKLPDQHLLGLQTLGKPQADMIEDELREIVVLCGRAVVSKNCKQILAMGGRGLDEAAPNQQIQNLARIRVPSINGSAHRHTKCGVPRETITDADEHGLCRTAR